MIVTVVGEMGSNTAGKVTTTQNPLTASDNVNRRSRDFVPEGPPTGDANVNAPG